MATVDMKLPDLVVNVKPSPELLALLSGLDDRVADSALADAARRLVAALDRYWEADGDPSMHWRICPSADEPDYMTAAWAELAALCPPEPATGEVGNDA